MHRSPLTFHLSSAARPARYLPPLLALAAVVWFGACGDPQPPVACGTIPQQTLHVGESELVTPCFEDPEMEPLSLSAESLAPEIVRASVVGDGVRVQAVSPGPATVRVTATDPDSLTSEVHFDVLVPNRPPEVRRTIPDVRLPPRGSSSILLSDYFSDPDASDLTYRVEFSDPSVATGSVAGDTLTATAGNAGTTTATVTATDPGGASVAQTFMVTVVEPQSLLRDDFESAESLAGWTVSDDSDASIEDGRFWLENVTSGFLGIAARSLSATEWRLTAALGNATSNAWVALLVATDHDRFSAYQIQIGADGNNFGLGDTNYRFLLWDGVGPEGQPTWLVDDEWYGQSDAIADVGELTNIVIAIESEVLTVTAGSAELVRIDLSETVLSGVTTEIALASWPSGETTGQRVFFDWIEARGIGLEDLGPGMGLELRSLDMSAPIRKIGSGDGIRRVEGGSPGSVNPPLGR